MEIGFAMMKKFLGTILALHLLTIGLQFYLGTYYSIKFTYVYNNLGYPSLLPTYLDDCIGTVHCDDKYSSIKRTKLRHVACCAQA